MTIKKTINSKEDEAFIKRAGEIAKATLVGKSLSICDENDPDMQSVRDIAKNTLKGLGNTL